MKRRIKLKHSFFLFVKLKSRIALTVCLVIITSFLLLKMFNNRITPILVDYVKIETQKMSTLLINNAIKNEFNKKTDITELIITSLNKDNEIVSVDFDTIAINKILTSLTENIHNNMELLEHGKHNVNETIFNANNMLNGKVYYIPFGLITNQALLTNVGPKIPIKTHLTGSVLSNIKTEIVNYGINNALLKICVEVNVSEKIILPFKYKTITTKVEVPVLIKLIQGNIPQVYGGAFVASSPIVSKTIE